MKRESKIAQPTFAPVSPGKLTEQVVSKIKNVIFSQGIKVHQKLPSERELAEQLGVSRTVVREALGTLQQLGLIETRRGRGAGAYVVDHLHKPLLDAAVDLMERGKIDIEQFLQARKAIECYSFQTAPKNITEEYLNRLEEINEEMLRSTDDELKVAEKSSLFHLTLLELSNNPLLMLMLQSLLNLMGEMRFYHPNVSVLHRSVYLSHSALIEAMRHKDWNRCSLLLLTDIDRIRELKPRGHDDRQVGVLLTNATDRT
jgi:GntR family transcriptional regulator, transcriptional repressor for pyruvate dehydrogenase complex